MSDAAELNLPQPATGNPKADEHFRRVNRAIDLLSKRSTGSGAAGATGATGAAGGTAAPCGRHTTLYSPVALWQLNGSLVDGSGGGYSLAVSSGTARYTDVWPGVRGFRFDGSTDLRRSTVTAALNITGDMTILGLFAVIAIVSGNTILIQCAATGETLNDNFLYSIILYDTGKLEYLAEYGAGVNISYVIEDGPPLGGVGFHMALVRASNQVQFYLNGETLGAASTGLAGPAIGAAPLQYISIGGDAGGQRFRGAIASFKIVPSALTAVQVRAEYALTLGKTFGL